MTHSIPKFIEPCIPKLAKALPSGPGWLHEPKIDGWRIQVAKAGDHVALFTRGCHDCASRLPRMVEAFRAIPANSCIIDGELVADEGDRIGNVFTINRASGDGREHQISVMAFDLIHIEGEDLRDLALIHRKNCLEALVRRAALPSLSYVAAHEDGATLLATMDSLGLEGVVSKRFEAPYRSGRRGEWVKVKCPKWIEINRDRWRSFSRREPSPEAQ